jgi:hypothetical protein
MEFIQKILPADYPRRTGYVYADDIGTLAFEDRKKPLTNDEITTVGVRDAQCGGAGRWVAPDSDSWH